MIHHVSFGTNDTARAKTFYAPLMELVGLRLLHDEPNSLDYGIAEVLFCLEKPVDGRPATAGNGAHVCFVVGTRGDVDRFHAIGLRQGGRDGGAPGLRPKYDPNYYGAFVYDLDGNKIEAVTYSGK